MERNYLIIFHILLLILVPLVVSQSLDNTQTTFKKIGPIEATTYPNKEISLNKNIYGEDLKKCYEKVKKENPQISDEELRIKCKIKNENNCEKINRALKKQIEELIAKYEENKKEGANDENQ